MTKESEYPTHITTLAKITTEGSDMTHQRPAIMLAYKCPNCSKIHLGVRIFGVGSLLIDLDETGAGILAADLTDVKLLPEHDDEPERATPEPTHPPVPGQ